MAQTKDVVNIKELLEKKMTIKDSRKEQDVLKYYMKRHYGFDNSIITSLDEQRKSNQIL